MSPDLGDSLTRLYRRLNRRVYVHPDPLEIVYRYEAPRDMEIAGLLAATLAYGRVAQICRSVDEALRRLDPHDIGPARATARATERRLRNAFAGFRHRFTPGGEVADLLIAAHRALRDHGSLEGLFASGCGPDDGTVLPALTQFVERLRAYAGGPDTCPTMLSSPADGSACKRLNLYLRWMVRHDAVDPGTWRCVPPSRLVVPLDTHMFGIARALHFTGRAGPSRAAAEEVTDGFRRFTPRDPVRYDFCLTRLGINPACHDEEMERLISSETQASRAGPGRGRMRS